MIRLLYLLILILSFIGCSKIKPNVTLSPNLKYNESEIDLIQRHQEYWSYLSHKDFENSFKYELKYQQYVHDLQWYKIFYSPRRDDYNVTLISIEFFPEKDLALVKTRTVSKDFDNIFRDVWYLIDDKWYHRYNDNLLNIDEIWK